MAGSRTLPWRKPRRELLLLTLVGLVAFTPLFGVNAQDTSRLCLSQALVHGRVSSDGCFGLDVAVYHGHEYSDKAPGLSLVEVPVELAVRLPSAHALHGHPWRLWLLRVLSVGLTFLACAFLIGRVSEGLAPGYGSISLVTFALGTLVAPYAQINFDQIPAGLLGLGAFLLAWRRRPGRAGLLAGAAVAFEYQAGLIVAVLAVYVALTGGWPRGLGRYVAGLLPGALLLGAYDWAAFGAPWRLSYRYVSNLYQTEQSSGFFGIGIPRGYGSYQVFAGDGGLLVVSPVVVAAAWGLVLLSKRYRPEAVVCGTVTALFVFANCGYFLPYGGSPGPRFLVPALPFLALGLGPAFAWRPRLTTALALLSVVTVTARLLIWGYQTPLRQGMWGEMARVPVQLGSSRFIKVLEHTVLTWVTPSLALGAALVVGLALTAFFVAVGTIPRAALRPGRERSRSVGRRGRALVVAGVCLLAAAEASVVFGFPAPPRDLSVSIQGSRTGALPGQEVDFTVWASNSSGYQGYGKVLLTIQLPPGVRLLGAPVYERGSGCKGSTTITCSLDSLSPGMTSPTRFGVEVTEFGDQTVTAELTAQGSLPVPPAAFTVGPA
jgi:hypothetical protein